MIALKDILYRVSLISTKGDMNAAIEGIHFDSRQIQKGFLFIAIKGTQTDGHQFIDSAIQRGAIAIVCEHIPRELPEEIVFVQVKNSAEALGLIAANFYDNPSAKLKIVAVTGTNGKSTVVTLIGEILNGAGRKTVVCGNIGNSLSGEVNRIDKETFCVAEVSSFQLEWIADFRPRVSCILNITDDHLERYRDFEDYASTKLKIFSNLIRILSYQLSEKLVQAKLIYFGL